MDRTQIDELIQTTDNVIATLAGGWCQGFYRHPNNRDEYCIVGAYYKQQTKQFWLDLFLKSLIRQGYAVASITEWNDSSGRTQEQVIDTLLLFRKELEACDSLDDL